MQSRGSIDLASSQEPPINRRSGWVPLAMTSTVLAMIVYGWLKHGFSAPRHDETGADHIAMLLMFGQLPIVTHFVISGRHELRKIAPVLAAQVCLWFFAFAAARL